MTAAAAVLSGRHNHNHKHSVQWYAKRYHGDLWDCSLHVLGRMYDICN
jgi:hypothetical protein